MLLCMYKFGLKHALLLFLCCSLSNSSYAQAFGEKKNVFSAGYGVVSFAGYVTSYIRYASYAGLHKKITGPFYFKYERAISRHIGLGVNVAYMHLNLNFRNQVMNRTLYDVNLDYNTLSVMARMNIHFGSFKKVDPYLGMGVGYRSGGWKASYRFISGNPNDQPKAIEIRTIIPVGFELTAGTRYWFSEYIGAYVEFGLAKSLLQLGITGRF